MPFTAIAGVIATSLGLAAAFVPLIATGLSVGASYLFSKYSNRRKTRTFTALQSETQFGGQVPRQSPFGLTAGKGHEVGYFKYGSGNAKNAYVHQLADFECDGLEPYIFLNGEKKTLLPIGTIGGEDAHYEIEGFQGLSSIRFYSGKSGQVVDQKLVDDTAALGVQWSSNSRGTGLCYVVSEYTYSSKWEAFPDVIWVLRGLKCYDPRKDDTVSGGVGSHRINDPSTFEFTKNPAIQRLNMMLGFKAPRTGRPIIGMGKSISQIDLNAHIAAANVCDTIRTIDGRNVATYECNLHVISNDDFSEILSEMEDAMAGFGINKAGIASVIAGAPQVASFDITEDDIRRDEGMSFSPKRNNDDLFNTLSGQYTNIDSQFQPLSLETITVNADVVEDNGIRQIQNDFLQVTDPDIAQYLLQIRYRQNRLGASVSIPLVAAKYYAVNAGDWGNYDGKLWMIVDKRDGRIQLGEVSNEIFSSSGILPGPVPSVPAIPSNPSVIVSLQGFGASSGVLTSSTGAIRPVIETTWTDPNDPSITSILIFYKSLGSSPEDNISHVITAPNPGAGRFTIDQNVVSGRLYEINALIITNPDRFRQATATILTSTPTKEAAIALSQFNEDSREIFERQSARLDSLEAALQEGLENQMLVDGNSYFQREVLQARTANALAAVVTEKIARISDVEALSQAIISAVASFDEGLAGGQFKVEASAGPAGVEARISLFVRAGTDQDFAEAGMYLDVVNAGTPETPNFVGRVAFDVSKFTIGNDGDQIFTIIDNEIVLNAIMRDAAGLFRIDPIAGQILISDAT